MLDEDVGYVPDPRKGVGIVDRQLVEPVLKDSQEEMAASHVLSVGADVLFVPDLNDFVFDLDVELDLVVEEAEELVAEGMGAEQFGGFMEAELELLFDGVIVRVVYDSAATQVVRLEGDNPVEACDFGVLRTQGEQAEERVDELLLAGQDRQVEHEVLDVAALLVPYLHCHCQVHLVERHLHAHHPSFDPFLVRVMVQEL
jgi:hypothetical protein